HSAHADLTSFPTRRSSDLFEPAKPCVRVGEISEDGCAGAVDMKPCVVLLCDLGQLVKRVDGAGRRRACQPDDGDRSKPRTNVFEDRKSTRLNSSHVKISYA